MKSQVAKFASSALAMSAMVFAVIMKPVYGNPQPPQELLESNK
jgi:hypothetical protein